MFNHSDAGECSDAAQKSPGLTFKIVLKGISKTCLQIDIMSNINENNLAKKMP